MTERDARNLPHRYESGECEAVWQELLALGDAVRTNRYVEPATEVCLALTTRAKANLAMIATRLDSIGYRFWDKFEEKMIELNGGDPFQHRAICFPPHQIDRIVGPSLVQMPLVLEVWKREIGCFSLLGEHRRLSPQYRKWPLPRIFPDPFQVDCYPMVDPFLDDEGEELDLELVEDEPGVPSTFDHPRAKGLLRVSLPDLDKSILLTETEVDQYCFVRVPSPAIDSKIEGLWYEATFVEYLRRNFRWGGFPGWERYSERPEEEIRFLAAGLLPI